MSSESCNRNNCTGTIEDGYCNLCGLATQKSSSPSQAPSARSSPLTSQRLSDAISSRTSSPITTGTGSSPVTNRSKGSRRTASTSSRSTRRSLGAGLVSIPELPSTAPEQSLLSDPKVPENKRFCANCNDALRREKGFCSKCGQKYSFIPSLKAGDIVANQYEIKGAIAFGGLGWIYLGFDNVLSRYVVLKGLLNTEDASSAAVAVAERQFLASVKHANIVGVYNFVNYGSEGFIVMEYIGGQTLKDIRKARGPLPIAEAIAYIHRILSAFGYLHQQGLVYCDFKPDNIMIEGGDVKLIDMGGVRRIDDLDGDIYGTVGYSAPEAGEGPTIVSDLYTIARSLAVLITNIPNFSKDNRYRLPNAVENEVFEQQESLYRWLLKATAENPDDRFQSAEEMAEQLLGVLREVVAVQTNQPRPATSQLFNGDMLAFAAPGDLLTAIDANEQQLPAPMMNASDPAINALLSISAIADPAKRRDYLLELHEKHPTSRETRLKLAESYVELSEYEVAENVLAKLETEDPWDWKVLWLRGRSLLAQQKPKAAQAIFDQVYFDLPGELAPKLGLAIAAEQAKNYKLAARFYDLVSQTDASYLSAVFGLARCRFALNDRQGAVSALDRVPPASSLYLRSRSETAQLLIHTEPTPPQPQELQRAAAAIETLTAESIERHHLTRNVLDTALQLLINKSIKSQSNIQIFGQPLEEVALRQRLEKVLRSMARLSTGNEKIQLVDEANRVRPKTLF